MIDYAKVYGTIASAGIVMYIFSLGLTVVYCALSGSCSSCGIV